jgi:PAS domain S-box-containing protein
MNSNLLPSNNYISVIRDITDTITFEKKLIESESLFSSIVKNSFEGIGLIDKDQKFIYCNSNLSIITGYEESEIIGKDFTSFLTKESRDSVVERFHKRINKTPVPARYIFSIQCKNGEIKILENSASYYIGADGNPYTIAQLKDITEQYNEKELLELSEKRFRSIVEYSFNGIGLINSNYTFVYANSTLSTIFGYPIEEIVGTNFKTFLTSESLKLVTERYEKRQRGESVPNQYEFTVKQKNGEIRFVEMSSTIIINNKGENQTLIQLQDITEAKEKNEAIKTSREQYKSIFDGAYDAIIHLDNEFNILNVNNSFIEMSGFTLEELIGKNPFYIAERIIPKDKIPEIFYIIKSSFKEGRIKPIEIEIDKTIIEFTAQKQSNGETIAVLRDITFRKNAEKEISKKEAKYQQLFNSSPDPIIIHDGKYIVDINPATIFATKIKDKSELIGKKLESLAHPKELERTSKRLEELKKTNKALNSEEFTIILNNGNEIDVIATPAPIEIDGRNLFMVTYHDISDLKQKERELKEAKDYLENIFDATSDAILIYDSETYNLINLNRQAKLMYGYSEGDISNAEVPLSTNNEKPFTVEEAKEKIEKTKKEGKQTFEWLSSRKDGTTFWTEVSLNKARIGEKDLIIASVRDINDRKIASLKLKESEERFKQLASLSFEGIIIHENGKAIDVNDAFENICGYTREEIISNNNIIDMFLVPEYKPIAYKNMQNNYASPYEVVGLNKNGERVDVELESRDVSIGKRKLRVTAIRDIREKKAARMKLEKSNQEVALRETTLRAIFDNSIIAIYIQDKEGKFIDINKGALEMYGYTKDELIGKDPSLISAEGKNNLEEVANQIELAFKGEPQQFEFWGKRKNGEIFPKTVRVSKGTYFGEEVVFAFATDISENKKHEQIQNILYNISMFDNRTTSMEDFAKYIQNELGKIIDTTNFYIGLYDGKDNTFSFPYYSDQNDSFKKATAEKTLGKYVMEIGKPLLADVETKKKLIKEGKLILQGTFSNEWMGAPLKTDSDTIGVIVVQNYKRSKAYSKSDLNLFSFASQQLGHLIKRKEQEEKIKAALVKAEESDRLKSAFLANMSHEIRTPMNGILGFTSLLKQNIIEPEEQAEAFDIIEKSGNRLLGIINDLIDISKIEAGQIKVKISEYSIYDQLKELYDFFSLEAQQRNLKLSLKVSEILKDVKVKTDNDKIQAILTNLIKNAIKYTPSGEIEFGYELMTNHLKFYVKDTGLGIDKDRQKAIFERFVQADIEDKHAMEGAGLGLAITKAYVEMLGGDIWLKSTINKGSTFYFSIPFDHLEAAVLQQQIDNQKVTKRIENEADLDLINILIAEDDKVSFFYLKTLLKFDNVRVIRAVDGVEAVSMMETNPEIDLILMDIRMPNMGGLEATKLIRKFNTDVIIIAQTANAMEGDHVKALEAGCNDYISKPIFKDVFYQVIEDNLKRKLG